MTISILIAHILLLFQVYDGLNSSAAQIGAYCGPIKQVPTKIRSTSNMLHVQFITDSTINELGFSVNFSSVEGIFVFGILRFTDPLRNDGITLVI